MAEPRFIHLRVHSDYSMIDGLAKTAPLVKRAAALAMPALAITDFTNLCGLVKFYGSAHGAGIKPIIGADFHVQSEELGDELAQLTVLASNNEGYQNLTLLISRAYQRGYGAAGPGSALEDGDVRAGQPHELARDLEADVGRRVAEDRADPGELHPFVADRLDDGEGVVDVAGAAALRIAERGVGIDPDPARCHLKRSRARRGP